ncbi:hypothetical protein BJY59DRAFT_333359 [Rhodotorula toruloides]
MREEGVVVADDRDLPRDDAEREKGGEGGEGGIVHNPSPLVRTFSFVRGITRADNRGSQAPAAVAGTAAGAALLGPDLVQKNTVSPSFSPRLPQTSDTRRLRSRRISSPTPLPPSSPLSRPSPPRPPHTPPPPPLPQPQQTRPKSLPPTLRRT